MPSEQSEKISDSDKKCRYFKLNIGINMKKGDALNLPKGWEIKKLGEVCELENGDRGTNYPSKAHRTEIGIPFINAGHLTSNGLDVPNMDFISRERFNLLRNGKIRRGDILFCLRGSLGKFARVQEFDEGAIASSLVIVRPKSKMLSEFLMLYFESKICADWITDFSNGAAQPNLSAGSLKEFEIPLPPLPEQQRIVAILDEGFSAIERSRNNAEQNLKNAKELFESVLNGQFTMDNGQLREGWEEKTLKEITNKIGSGATPRGGNESYKTEGISLIRSMNVHDFDFKERNLAFIDDKQAKELNNVTLEESDVLLNITGASVARCCMIPKEYLPARVNQHVSIIRAKKEIINPVFLNLLLTSKFYKNQLLFTGEQGATRQAITKAQLEVFSISFPQLKTQQTIVQKLDALSAETKKLEAIYHKKLKDLDELKKSILQKAFSGQLRIDNVQLTVDN